MPPKLEPLSYPPPKVEPPDEVPPKLEPLSYPQLKVEPPDEVPPMVYCPLVISLAGVIYPSPPNDVRQNRVAVVNNVRFILSPFCCLNYTIFAP